MTGLLVAVALTFVPNCGNTSYLQYKPARWSGGCTGGSLNIGHIKWSSWTATSARGTGRSELRVTVNEPLYPARSTIRLSRPRKCTNEGGGSYTYFSRVTVRIRFRAGNPFGEQPGWRASTETITPDEGLCTRS